MAMKKGGFERKSSVSDEIPSSSLADIAFLLLIFFMVTTVFRTTKERDIVWPEAVSTQKIDEKKKFVLSVWLEREGAIWINDRPVALPDVSNIVAPLYASSDRRLVISIRGDREVPYRFIDALTKELQEGGAVRVVFATDMERQLTRPMR